MQAPLAPPRALNASADASSARAWSSSESTGDSKTVISPIFSGIERLVARAVVPQADGLVVHVDRGRGVPTTTTVAGVPSAGVVAAARGGDERQRQQRSHQSGQGSRHRCYSP